MKIRLVISFLIILFSISKQAEANWWRILELAGDAAKVTTKIVARTTRDVLKVHPSPRNAHVLSMTNGQVFAENIAGNRLLIATTGATGVLTVSPDAMTLFRNGMDLIVSETDLGGLTDVIKQAINVYGKTVKVIYENGKIGRLITKQVNGSNILLAEAYQGVFLEVGSQYSDDLIWALQQNFHSTDIKVISLFDETDADILRHIDSAIGELHNPAGNKKLKSIIKLIDDKKQKNIFIVGHIENNNFVVRNASGNITQKIPISDLETAAKDADSSLFLLGCSVGFRSNASGFINPVNALDVAKGLKAVIGQTSFGDALSALSTISGDTVIRPHLVDSVRISVIADKQMLQKLNSKISAIRWTTRVSMLSRIRVVELEDRIIPLIPSSIQYTYIVGFIFLLPLYTKIMKYWGDHRIPAPSFKYRPLNYIFIYVIRSCVFILLMPFTTIAYYAVAYFSGCVIGIIWAIFFILILFLSANISTFIASIISYTFGLKYWKNCCYKIEDESWHNKFLNIPIFYLATIFLTNFTMEKYFNSSINYFEFYLVSLESFILIITDFTISLLLYSLLKKMNFLFKWLYSELNDFVIMMPIILIEYFVVFIVCNQKKEINNE